MIGQTGLFSDETVIPDHKTAGHVNSRPIQIPEWTLAFTCRASDKHCGKMFCMKTDKHEVSHRDGTAATDGSSSCQCELVFHLKIPFSECSHSPEIVFPSCAVEVHMVSW